MAGCCRFIYFYQNDSNDYFWGDFPAMFDQFSQIPHLLWGCYSIVRRALHFSVRWEDTNEIAIGIECDWLKSQWNRECYWNESHWNRNPAYQHDITYISVPFPYWNPIETQMKSLFIPPWFFILAQISDSARSPWCPINGIETSNFHMRWLNSYLYIWGSINERTSKLRSINGWELGIPAWLRKPPYLFIANFHFERLGVLFELTTKNPGTYY